MVGLVSEYPTSGTPLDGRWEGARAVHFWHDDYRLVWENDDEVETIIVLRIGRKKRRRGTIYDLPRPESPLQGPA